MKNKGRLSRGVRCIRENLKRSCTSLAGKLCGAKSYSIFGVPAGLTADVAPLKEIYPSQRVELTPPVHLDESVHWRFQSVLEGITVPPQGILTLPHYTATALGGNLSPAGKLLTVSLQSIDGKSPHQHDLFRFSRKRFFPSIYSTSHPVATLTGGWQGAFYHWMHEILPRFHLLEKEKCLDAKIYVEAQYPFQIESLKLLGVQPEHMINAQTYAAVTSPLLIVPSLAEVPTLWSCQFLRDKFLPFCLQKTRQRIYISRRDAQKRRVLNEEELIPLLNRYGFVCVELSKLSFLEQMQLFASAEMVIGPHGAGFSHLVFCPVGTPFLEFFSPAYTHLCYWHLANRVGLTYHYLFGEGMRYPNGIDPHLDPDMHIDCQKLETLLKKMGC